MNCPHSLRTENRFKWHENVCKSYYDNHREKSIKVPFAIYAYTESLLEKIDTWRNNIEKLVKSKANTYATCGYSLSTHYSLDTTKNKHNYYQGEDCMKNFCKKL